MRWKPSLGKGQTSFLLSMVALACSLVIVALMIVWSLNTEYYDEPWSGGEMVTAVAAGLAALAAALGGLATGITGLQGEDRERRFALAGVVISAVIGIPLFLIFIRSCGPFTRSWL